MHQPKKNLVFWKMKESFLLAKRIHSTNTLEVLHSQWVPEVEKTMPGTMQCQVNWAGNRSRQEEVAGSYIKTWIEKKRILVLQRLGFIKGK